MAKFEQYRGDYREFTVTVPGPLDTGAVIYFAIKPPKLNDAVDTTDANAIFTVDVTNADATVLPDGDVRYKVKILPSYTKGKANAVGKFIGEITHVSGDGKPTTYNSIEYIIKPDTNQRG